MTCIIWGDSYKMLPSIVARQVHESIREFLVEQFRTTTEFFQKNGDSIIEEFVNSPSNVYKGPWLDIKLPFETSSETTDDVFRHLKPEFQPYAHQRKAYERLSTATASPQSTIIATGTGSGKTECFAYPVLDHCLEAKKNGERGIKAIIIYPMNALAVDQSRRFAKEAHALNSALSLEGNQRLRIGRYTGEDFNKDERVRIMTPTEVINCRSTLRDNPPDVLLTNYKMLDYLLMRAEDHTLWRFNQPNVLRYLIVDELHTFDGAQGTDLACLIRRLRARLQTQNDLICVGTSATIGSGENALDDLCNYATSVFSTPFTRESIIGEQRLDIDAYFERHEVDPTDPLAGHTFELYPIENLREIPVENINQHVLMEHYAAQWFSDAPAHVPPLRFANVSPQERLEARIELGRRLRKHNAFKQLLTHCKRIADLQALADHWLEVHTVDYRGELTQNDVLIAIDSLISLIAYARDANGTDADGNVRAQPMLHVRTQLWMRELRRMTARLSHTPELKHADDLTNKDDGLHLPLVHCRECLALGWGTVWGARTEPLSNDLRSFYSQWFNFGSDVCVLYPLTPEQQAPTHKKGIERWVCGECGDVHIVESEDGCCHINDVAVPLVRVWIPHMETLNKDERPVRDDRCPWCKEHNALSIVGSQAASLASVGIAKLFGSNHTDDRKLISFSDSVQDAAHRAGFFGARTYRQVSRLGLQQIVAHQDAENLKEFSDLTAHYWRSTLGDDDFVGTFIAPDMEWLYDYQELLRHHAIPNGSNLAELVEKRLRWDTYVEFGLRARIGRSLERTGVATIAIDDRLLQTVAKEILTGLREHVEGFRSLRARDLHVFVRGLLRNWRYRGAFDVEEMRAFVAHKGNTFVWTKRAKPTRFYLPKYGTRVAPPTPLLFEINNREGWKSVTPITTTARHSSLWSDEWFRRTLQSKEILAIDGESHQITRTVVDVLLHHKILNAADDGLRPNVFLLNPEKWRFYSDVEEVHCDVCKRREPIPASALAAWINTRCMRTGCQGQYAYASTRQEAAPVEVVDLGERLEVPPPTRVVASEHTSLLESSDRKQIEDAFIESKHTWDVNLLSSTPTLEMGIDIGDLSTVLLCSVPPSQANYLQRIGRAGRRDGNALSMVIANAKPHDNYFFAQPVEMMDGTVQTPGVYLQALAVLERQLTAFAFDNWCKDSEGKQKIPSKLKTVLDGLDKNDPAVFPHDFLRYVETNSNALIEGFLELFQDLGEEGETHLRNFLEEPSQTNGLRYRVLNELHRVSQTRRNFSDRIKAAQKAEEDWRKKPDDEAKEQMLEELAEERKSLHTLRNAINKKHTLNFFTDEGLLPNYAFPEEGVTLQSVIVRDKGKSRNDDDAKRSADRYEYRDYVFQRKSSAALQELAPESRFYAAAHQLTIERVDLAESPIETWRLCDRCDYAERVNENQHTHDSCPRCQSDMWADVGQERQLIRLRQVYAFARAGDDNIDDSHENRHTTFYERQLLVDIPPECQRKAYAIDDVETPFGFEYLDKVDFRELNFGELTTQGQKFRVANKEAVRQGFQVCKDCGMVRPKRKRDRRFHAFDCPVRQDAKLETDEQYIESLYLYRELRSESLRFLLPLSQMQGSQLARGSFVAALQLGLRKHFKGSVQHLEATTMAPYAQEGEGAREYVLFYDTVPGGTGYLKDLARDPNNIFSAFEKALDTLLQCPTCSQDDTRDGCYQCLLAYRNVYSKDDISRQKAIQLIQELLKNRDKLKAIESVDAMEVNSLLESPLEARLVHQLRAEPELEVFEGIVDGKQGYTIYAGELRWELIPQYEVLDPDSDAVVTRSDFYLRLVQTPTDGWRQEDRRRFQFQIYVDGHQYHYNIVAEDVRKRQTVLRTGHRPWVLTYKELAEDEPRQYRAPLGLLCMAQPAHSDTPVSKYILEQIKPEGYSGRDVQDAKNFLKGNNFTWLVKMLVDPLGTEAMLKRIATLETMLRIEPTTQETPSVTDLQARLPQRVVEWMQPKPLFISGFQDAKRPPHAQRYDAVRIYSWMRNPPTREDWNEHAGIGLWIDDARIAEGEAYREAWELFWASANVLQFAPTFTLIAQTDIDNHAADSAWPDWPERTLRASYVEQVQAGMEIDDWRPVYDDVIGAQLPHEDIERLENAGVEVPVVGVPILEQNGVGLEAELAWSDAKVAVLLEAEVSEYSGQLPDWRLVNAHDAKWVERVIRWLNEGA